MEGSALMPLPGFALLNPGYVFRRNDRDEPAATAGKV
jgi:hypothetical protein